MGIFYFLERNRKIESGFYLILLTLYFSIKRTHNYTINTHFPLASLLLTNMIIRLRHISLLLVADNVHYAVAIWQGLDGNLYPTTFSNVVYHSNPVSNSNPTTVLSLYATFISTLTVIQQNCRQVTNRLLHDIAEYRITCLYLRTNVSKSQTNR